MYAKYFDSIQSVVLSNSAQITPCLPLNLHTIFNPLIPFNIASLCMGIRPSTQ